MTARLFRFLRHQLLGTLGVSSIALIPITGAAFLHAVRSLSFGERDLLDNLLRLIVGVMIGRVVCRQTCEASVFWIWLLPFLLVGYAVSAFLKTSVFLNMSDFWTATCSGAGSCEYRLVSVGLLSSAIGYIAGAALGKRQYASERE